MRVPPLYALGARYLFAASLTVIPSSALAQVVEAQVADSLVEMPIAIPAQPLAEALVVFSRQAGVRVSVDSVVAAGLFSRAVTGSLTPPEALRHMLEGTGLVAHFSDSRSALLRKADAGPVAAPQLRAVRVVADRRAGYVAARTTSATKTETRLRDVPQSVTVVTRDLMKDQAMQGMADVLRYVPGVTMGQGEGNRDQPTIRGNATTADFFVDGVRDDVQYFRDLYNVERVEALKGSNAMVFGRGGGGGVLNRVTKEPQWTPVRELTLQGGSYDNKRVSADVGQGLTGGVAARLNAVYEESGVFREGVTLDRYGLNPVVTFAPGAKRTSVTLGYEYFSDHRTADRGIPSFEGRPLRTSPGTFFGDPRTSYADASASSATATVTRESLGGVSVRNRTRLAWYDKVYQNVFPGAVDAAGEQVSISAYNNATRRRNLFNQSDLTYGLTTGAIRHTLLMGVEVGRQVTNNVRNTGYFDNTATTVSAPVRSPTISTSVTFRPSATDADNRVTNTAASVYAQDQIALSSHWQLIAGLRYERFDVRYHNNRTDSALRRVDGMLSPRAGLVFKPIELLSLYASHSVSFLPSAGDQFSSLTDVTKGLEPERFANYELGAKWDLADRLALTAAAYRLDRTNTRAPDPRDPTKTVQSGSLRTKGYEVAVSGSVTPAWQIAGGFSNQDAVITGATTAAPAGARVPQVPRNTLSVWNKYQIARRLGIGVGVIHRSDMYAALDNKVTVPGFTEVDGALFVTLGKNLRAQVNVENLFDETYYATAHSNNNITPGSPRAVKVVLTSGF